ncbi:fumarate hydratase [Candidatus Margulisiibacteriota bacterium]
MKEIGSKKISETVRDLYIQANYEISDDVLHALNEAMSKEHSVSGKEIIRDLIKNAEIARKEVFPICQDTGLAVVFLEIGQEVKITGGSVEDAVNEGISSACKKGYLRRSVVADPFERKNTGSNTPAITHYQIVPGKNIKITVMAKGGGAENKSTFRMFKPTSSKGDIIDFVTETARTAGGAACPPFIIGVGIGGNLETSTMLAKKALLRKVGIGNNNADTAQMESEMLEKINKTGIGPAGLGGTTTALSVAIEKAPCHIASLPVTVNIDCHAHRVKEAVI